MKLIDLRNFNLNIALKIILLLGFAAFFIVCIANGKVSLYVHPRIIPFIIFASIVMIIMAFTFLKDLFNPINKKMNFLPIVIFMVPLLLAVTVQPKVFDSSANIQGQMNLSGSAATVAEPKTVNKNKSSQKTTATTKPSTTTSTTGSDSSKSATGIVSKDGEIVMDSDNFYTCINELYSNLDKYIGLKVEMTGFVYKENDYAANEFVPARMLMVCCTADLVPTGVLCWYNNTIQLAVNSWVKVTGTVGKKEFNGETIPYINVQSVISAPKPDQEYIYPY